MPSMTPDAVLVRRCLEGDATAWSAILTRYADLAYGVLRQQGLDAAAADDAFQEVAVALWKSLRRLERVDRLASWIGTTARRVAWRARRRARTRSSHEVGASRADRAPDVAPPDAAAATEEEQALREALEALGPRCRELLSLLYFQSSDLGYDEIARRLGVPRGSLGPTRQRCLASLRDELLRRHPGLGAEAGPAALAARPPVSGRPSRRTASMRRPSSDAHRPERS